jgi:hypothetical protein
MKSWLPWLLAFCAVALLLEERWAGGVTASIEARDDTLEAGRARIRAARLTKVQTRAPLPSLRKRYRGFKVDSLLARTDSVVTVPRDLLVTADSLITADSVALAADDSLDAAQADQLDVADRQIHDLKKQIRRPWLTASAALFVRTEPGLRGELELGIKGLVVRGVLEADSAGMRRRLEVGVRRSVRLF